MITYKFKEKFALLLHLKISLKLPKIRKTLNGEDFLYVYSGDLNTELIVQRVY